MDTGMCYISGVLTLALFTCSACYECSWKSGMTCTDKTISGNGSIRFVAIISMHNSVNGKCDSVNTQGFQAALALQWITGLLNGNGSIDNAYIPGITLGYDIYDDCGLSSRATDAMLDFLPEGKPDDLVVCSPSNSTPPLFAGVLAMTSLEATSSSAALISSGIPLISGQTRSPNLDDIPNVFYTVPDVTNQMQAILELLEKIQWYYVAVVYTDEDIATSSLEILTTLKKKTNICFGLKRQIKVKGTRSSADVTADVKALINVLESEQSNYVKDERMGVIYIGSGSLANTIIKNIIDEPSKQAKKLQWLMISNIKTDPVFIQTLQNDQGVDLSILTASVHNDITFTNFKEVYLDILTSGYSNETYSPWIKKVLQNVYPECAGSVLFKCDRSTLERRYYQDESSYSVIIAALTMAAAIQKVHKEKCNAKTGICENLRNNDLAAEVTMALPSVDVVLNNSKHYPKELIDAELLLKDRHFHVNGSSLFTFFKCIRNGQNIAFNKIGEYKEKTLEIDTQSIYPSLCNTKCSVCGLSDDIKFSYIPGDTLLLGLFSMRYPSQDDKFGCGELRPDDQSFVTMLAFLEGVKGLAKIKDRRIGGIALDDCYNPLYITQLLSQLFSKKLVLYDEASSEHIDFDKVRLVIGGLSSDVTISVVDFMTKLNIPVISYGASSAFLDNRFMFPYFSRTVPSDTLQTNGMVALLKNLDFTFVGAIYADGTYGYNGIREVEKKAESNGICLDTLRRVTKNFGNEYIVLERNLTKNLVKVVTFFGTDTIALDMLNKFQSSFIYIASESWGRNEGLKGSKSENSLVFETVTSYHVGSHFLTYLKSITPNTLTNVPWMHHFWERQFPCSFPWSYEEHTHSVCDMNSKLSEDKAEMFSKQQRPIHISHAVQAAWKACNDTGLCTLSSAWTKAYADQFSNAIRQVRLITQNGTTFRPFKDDGNGGMGLTIYRIVKKNAKYEYDQVGSYNEDKGLQLSASLDYSNVEAKCSSLLCGDICIDESQPQITTKATTANESGTVAGPANDTTITTVTIVLAVVVGVVVIAVILLIVLLFRQHKTNVKITKDRSTSGSHHVSTQNLYDEVRSIQGLHNSGLNVPSISSGIAAGSSAGSSSLARRDNTPVQYSDIAHSNPDLTKAKVPIRTKSHLSQSLSSLSGSVENNSNATESLQRRQLQKVKLSVPNSVSASDKLTYISAEDLGMDDEEVSAHASSYLELSGTESNQSIPLNDGVHFRKKTPRHIQRSNEDVSIDNDQIAAYFRNKPQRPVTLPGINAFNVKKPNIAEQGFPSQAVSHNTSTLPDVHTRPELYLHPIYSPEYPMELKGTPYLQNQLSNSQPNIPTNRLLASPNYPQSISDGVVHPAGSYLQLPSFQNHTNRMNELYLEPSSRSTPPTIPLQSFATSSQVPYYPTHFIDENGVIYIEQPTGQNIVSSSNLNRQQNQIQSPQSVPHVVVSRPENVHVVHSHANPVPFNQNATNVPEQFNKQLPLGVAQKPRVVNSVGENIVNKIIAQMNDEEEVII